MIDIIIPVYNSHDTLIETLASIYIQRIKDKAKIYIIDDHSTEDYSDILELFSDKLNITYYKLDKNMGPGYARQFGIDKSDSEYIMFIDSDDQLYNCYALEILYKGISENNLDVIMSHYYIENDNGRVLSDETDVNGCLHGKIYSRKHLIKENIRFNNSRYSEDCSFHLLVIATAKRLSLLDNIVYVYRNNTNSLVRNKKKYILMHCSYLHNVLWAVNQLEKKKAEKRIIINILISSYYYIYRVVTNNEKVDFSKLYKYCYRYEEKYKKYSKDITKTILADFIDEKDIVEFNKFRKNFESR